MMLRTFNIALLVMVIVSALGVVYSKHQNRMLYVEIRKLQKQRDELDINWGRLQLEQSTWATHSRIEKMAREKLAMRTVKQDEIVIIKP